MCCVARNGSERASTGHTDAAVIINFSRTSRKQVSGSWATRARSAIVPKASAVTEPACFWDVSEYDNGLGGPLWPPMTTVLHCQRARSSRQIRIGKTMAANYSHPRLESPTTPTQQSLSQKPCVFISRIYIYVYNYIYIYINIYIFGYVYMCMYIYIYIHADIHTYIHTCIHRHTYIHKYMTCSSERSELPTEMVL